MGNLGFLMEGLNNMGITPNLLTILSMLSIFFILKGMAQYVSSIYHVNLRQLFVKTIRINLSNELAKMSYRSFAMTDAGRIQNTMSGEVSRISKAYQEYSGTFQQVVLVVVYMAFAFLLDAKFALLISVGGALTNLFYKKIYAATKTSSTRLTKGSHFYQGLILQFVSYFKYLKATGHIKQYNQKLKKSIEDIEESNRQIGRLGSIVIALREPVLIIVVSVVILLQVTLLNGSLGTILVSLLFFYRALSSLILMQSYYNNFLAVSGSMDNMMSFEEELKSSREEEGKIKIEKFNKVMNLKNVAFFYSDQQILRDINLTIYQNQTLAFVGESGSGKTTLLNILCGLLPVSQGIFTIDGVNSQEMKIESFQRRIGYITQEPVIFNDTIFNNISFWAEPSHQNIARFEKAVRQASIETFLQDLPERENTYVGNNGINLSGGQKQRISIARELFKEVDILVLDEATSALDSETEEAIQKGLESLQGQYTILIVAHRLSTVKNADRIVIMNKGEIVDEGNFGDLLINSSKFQKMVKLQEV